MSLTFNWSILSVAINNGHGQQLSFTLENAADLHSVGCRLLVTNKGSRLSPAQTTGKVKYKLRSQ